MHCYEYVTGKPSLYRGRHRSFTVLSQSAGTVRSRSNRSKGCRCAAKGLQVGAEIDASNDASAAESLHFRAIFISDCHLGTPAARPRRCSSFSAAPSRIFYLVGDIIDGWQLKRRWYWHQLHNDVVQKVLRKARKGTLVFYVPGNHDEAARHYVGVDFGGVAIREEATHVTSRGRRSLVTHGDLFDGGRHRCEMARAAGRSPLHAHAQAEPALQRVARARIGLPYWSLSQFLKFKVKNAVSYITAFEEALAREARTRGFDGVVCGHIHHAEIRDIGGVLYCNPATGWRA